MTSTSSFRARDKDRGANSFGAYAITWGITFVSKNKSVYAALCLSVARMSIRLHVYRVSALLASVWLGACADAIPVQPHTVAPTRIAAARLSDASACVSPATAVATSELEVHAELLAAHPGDVIAVSGMITLTRSAVMNTPDVTLTCLASGDGLRGRLGPSYDLVLVAARDIRLQGLLLDGWTMFGSPVRAVRTFGMGPSAFTRGLVFQRNHVRCNSSCLFSTGVRAMVITDNFFETDVERAGGTGVHIQAFPVAGGRADSIRIERNVLVAAKPTAGPLAGAIRTRDGEGVVVRDNEIIGPWSNGIALADLHNSVIERNTVSGVRQHGLMLGAFPLQPISHTGLLIRGNTMSTLGNIAIWVDSSCGNFFVANKLMVPPGGTPVFFTSRTGNNVLVGETGMSVDNGARDCDGDGQVDPNVLSGARRRGTEPPGSVIAPVIQHSTDLL